MRLSLIVAMDHKGVIGRGGGLPWRLSADLKRFKTLTMGHHLVMGRKTFQSLGRLLPGRIMLVLKRPDSPYDFGFARLYQNLPLYDAVVAAKRTGRPPPEDFVPVALINSLDEALRLAAGDEEVFVIGGAEIFALALSCCGEARVERMYVTWVESDVEGDVTFPQVDWTRWREVSSERVAADERNEFETRFCVYERVDTKAES
jgi:dihydrofolate reductase